MTGIVEEAVAERIRGEETGRLRALAAAIVVGLGAAVLAYRLLRNSGSSEDDDDDREDDE